MSPTRMPCPPPVTSWTSCYRKTPNQALAPPPQALGFRGLVRGPRALAPMAAAPQEVEPVSPPNCAGPKHNISAFVQFVRGGVRSQIGLRLGAALSSLCQPPCLHTVAVLLHYPASLPACLSLGSSILPSNKNCSYIKQHSCSKYAVILQGPGLYMKGRRFKSPCWQSNHITVGYISVIYHINSVIYPVSQ